MAELDSFTCAVCQGVFIKEVSDEQAWAEAEALFTPSELEDPATVCDLCFKLMTTIYPIETWRQEHGTQADT
jgi:hypothetical protein